MPSKLEVGRNLVNDFRNNNQNATSVSREIISHSNEALPFGPERQYLELNSCSSFRTTAQKGIAPSPHMTPPPKTGKDLQQTVKNWCQTADKRNISLKTVAGIFAVAKVQKWNHAEVLRALPDALRLPYLVEALHWRPMAPEERLTSLPLDAIPVYSKAAPGNRDKIAKSITRGLQLMAAIKNAVDPQAQRKLCESLKDFTRKLPSAQAELRFAIVAFMARELGHLGQNHGVAVDVLRAGFDDLPDLTSGQEEFRSKALHFTLQNLPDHQRTQFFLQAHRPGELQLPALDLIPLYRDAKPELQPEIRKQLRAATKLMAKLEDSKGDLREQERVLEELKTFAESIRPELHELRYAVFTTIASKFQWLEGTKLQTIRMLKQEFDSRTPTKFPQQQWRADAISTMLDGAVQFGKSNYTVKEAVNVWRDMMLGNDLTHAQRFEITRSLIRALPRMDTTLQSFTSRYNPQAKAIKYLERLLAPDPLPLIKGGAPLPALPERYRLQLVQELQQVLPELDDSRRNPSRASFGQTGLAGWFGTAGSTVGATVIGAGVGVSVAAITISGGAVAGLGALAGAGACLMARQESNRTRAQNVISNGSEGSEPAGTSNSPNAKQFAQQVETWSGDFSHFGGLRPRDAWFTLGTFREDGLTSMGLGENFGRALLAKAIVNMDQFSVCSSGTIIKTDVTAAVVHGFRDGARQVAKALVENIKSVDPGSKLDVGLVTQFVASRIWDSELNKDAIKAVLYKVGPGPAFINHIQGRALAKDLTDEIAQAVDELNKEFAKQLADAYFFLRAATPAFVALAKHAFPYIQKMNEGAKPKEENVVLDEAAKECLRNYLEPKNYPLYAPDLDLSTFEIVDNALNGPNQGRLNERYQAWRQLYFGDDGNNSNKARTNASGLPA